MESGFLREALELQTGKPGDSARASMVERKEEPMLIVLVKFVHQLFGRITVRILWRRKGRR